MPKPSVSFVGAGAFVAGMARALVSAGYSVPEIAVSRGKITSRHRALAKSVGATVSELVNAKLDADLIWIAVADDAIADCAKQLAMLHSSWHDKVVLHGSGALTSDELRPLRKRGASIGSAHPMMSFVASATAPKLEGVGFAVEGDAPAVRMAKRVVRDFRGKLISLRKQDKALYHAFGSMLSPLLVAELTAALAVARRAGIAEKQARAIMRPIVLRTVENLVAHGPQAAFSGPLVRGDAKTIQKHLAALQRAPEERSTYRQLARYATSRLKVRNRKELVRILD